MPFSAGDRNDRARDSFTILERCGASIRVRRFLMRTERKLTWIAALGIGLLGTATMRADSVVILGAGQISNWITSGFVANPNPSQSDLMVAPSPIIATLVPCFPPALCPFYNVS